MRHKKDLAKLGRPSAHRKSLTRSLVRSLLMHDRIKTTLTKAKAAQRVTERLIRRSQRDDLASRRYAYSHLGDHELVKHLFDEIMPRFDDRASGFTRIFMLGNRLGDGAQMAVLEMAIKIEEKKGGARTRSTKPKETSRAKSRPDKKESAKKKMVGKEAVKKDTAKKDASKKEVVKDQKKTRQTGKKTKSSSGSSKKNR